MSTVLPPDDDDRTVTPQATQAEHLPGTDTLSTIATNQNALPVGTMLGEFEITGLIGDGGFGIVYLAYDHSLQRSVALKEYMPSTLAGRGTGVTVVVKSGRYTETFQAGLRSFVNEARLLAQFDHPSLVKVYRFWESNGTAYMVMPFYRGMTLKEALKLRTEPPDEAWLKALLAQLLDALSVIHEDHCLHRDIAPDNILMLPDGRPLLLDFGAARRVIGNMTHALTVILKPGYAPMEQYADVPTMKQGPWTDIYALAAMIYFAIMGHAPTPAVGRMMSDPMVPLSEAVKGRYSANFLQAIDLALSVKPEDRPQNVTELRTLLGLTGQHRHQQLSPHEPMGIAQAKVDHGARPTDHKRPPIFYIAALVILVAGVGIGIFLLPDKPDEITSVAAPAVPVAPTATSLQATPQIIEKKPFDSLKALDEIFDQRDRNHAVTVSVEKAQTRIGKDPLRFRIRSARPGYVYILMVGTNRSDFFLLFPNAVDKNNRVNTGEQLDLPRPEWKMMADGPPGTDHFIVIVSDRPRDFSTAGLKTIDPFAEFLPRESAGLYRDYTGSTPLFAGKASCPRSIPNCSKSYGAAVFSIEEVGGT